MQNSALALAQDVPETTRPDSAHLVADFAATVGRFGYTVVEVSGELETMRSTTETNVSSVNGVIKAVENAQSASGQVLQSTEQAMEATRMAAETVQNSAERVSAAATKSTALATWAQSVGTRADELLAKVAKVDATSKEIDRIAEEINILAINASIESARAGEAGKGFAVISQAINNLANSTQTTLMDIRNSLGDLSEEAEALRSEGQDAQANAEAVIGGAGAISEAFETVRDYIGQINTQAETIVSDGQRIEEANNVALTAVRSISSATTATAESIADASERLLGVVDDSEHLVGISAHMGANTSDTRFVERVQAGAAELSAIFEKGVASHQISERDLFDLTLKPIAGTNPQQFVAPFTGFLERVGQQLIEDMLGFDPKIIFSAPAAKNGYLAIHNRKFSKPQGADPVWNTANCRNRRVFDDRVGLKAGKNQKPFLLQTYRRDMGDHFLIMKDVSAPIFVNGKHWGGLRLAYKF